MGTPDRAGRLVGFDVARSLAVFGMVAVNFKVAMGASERGPDWLVAVAGLLDGRAAATFVVLAGVGVSLMAKGALASGDPAARGRVRTTLLKRALFLLVAGLLYTPLWPADILHFYGVYLLAAAALFAARGPVLWLAATAATLAFPLLLTVLDYERGWDWETLEYEGLFTPAGMVRHLLFNGFHPFLPWVAFLLFGIWLGRRDFASAATRRWLFLGGLAVAAVTEGLSRLAVAGVRALGDELEPQDLEDLTVVLSTSPMPPMPWYLLAGAGTATCLIVLCVALGQRFGERPWLRPLISTGQLALTLYVGHVVVGMGSLFALGLFEDRSLAFALAASAVFCGLAVLFSWLWRRRFARGPLEAVMRRVT